MSNQQQQFPQRAKNALDNNKLDLVTKYEGQRAALKFNVIKNNPRFTVWTGRSTDKGSEKIEAALDTPTYFAFLNIIKKIVAQEGDGELRVVNTNYTFFGGKKSDRPEVVSELFCGKDSAGVYIGVTARKSPVIKFYFGRNDWHQLCKADGTPLAEAVVSKMYAEAYVTMMECIAAHVMVITYAHPEPKQQGGGGGGSWNRGGGDGGSKSMSEGDFPF